MSNVIKGNVSGMGQLKGGVSALLARDGEDGFSPIVSVSKVGKVTTIDITDKNGTKTATIKDGEDVTGGGGGGVEFEVGVGLKLKDGVLSVDSATDFNGDNSRPAEAALVQTLVGNVEIILKTI